MKSNCSNWPFTMSANNDTPRSLRLRESRCGYRDGTCFEASGFYRIPFPDRSLDVVVDFGTCYHVTNAGQTLKEIARVLAAGGTFSTKLHWVSSWLTRSAPRATGWRGLEDLRSLRGATPGYGQSGPSVKITLRRLLPDEPVTVQSWRGHGL